MTLSFEEKLALAASLLNEDGTVTPADNLPAGLLSPESKRGIAADYTAALIADSLSHAFKLARQRLNISAQELAKRRHVSKGRISQLESITDNPKILTVAEHAEALGYEIKIVMTPRGRVPAQRIEIPVKAPHPYQPQAAD